MRVLDHLSAPFGADRFIGGWWQWRRDVNTCVLFTPSPETTLNNTWNTLLSFITRAVFFTSWWIHLTCNSLSLFHVSRTHSPFRSNTVYHPTHSLTHILVQRLPATLMTPPSDITLIYFWRIVLCSLHSFKIHRYNDIISWNTRRNKRDTS